MRFCFYILIVSIFLISCEDENNNSPSFSSKYNRGLYIATDEGVSFYDDGDLENNIFQDVNGISLNNVNRIKIDDKKIYIASSNNLYVADIKTFENLGVVSGFSELVDFDFVYNNRIFAIDRAESHVKEIDSDHLQIISEIETGDTTRPTFIVTKTYRSFILNGGSSSEDINDSLIIAIDHRYGNSVTIADFMGALSVGYNPNSAVNNNDILVLCRGIYNDNNTSLNTNSSLVRVDGSGELEIDWIKDLTGIYNANNLVLNLSDDLSFTCSNGIYKMNKNGTGAQQILPIISDILYYHEEEYPITTSTIDTIITPDTSYIQTNINTYYENRDILYVNDSENNKNIIYKYNITDGLYIDTIEVNSKINDLVYY